MPSSGLNARGLGRAVPSTDDLLILIIRDVGLRSMLVGRLSMEGADVYTAAGLDCPGLSRTPRGAVLVLDEAALKRSPMPIEALLNDERWAHVVLVGEPEPSLRGLIPVPASAAPARIAELLRAWRANSQG